MQSPTTPDELDELLSRPTPAVLETLSRHTGDLILPGCGGKIGPTLARMAIRGVRELGQSRRVIAVSRFSSRSTADALRSWGVETHSCDLLDRSAVGRLPDAPLVISLIGQKFGTRESPALTWATNTLAPSYLAERYAGSRIVALSTGCVYPLVDRQSTGAAETDPLTPPGEYANSCVARERIFEYHARRHGTPLILVRLCYAIDLRYGVLLDLAQKIWAGQPIDVGMAATQIIWQGDANARILQCLDHAAVPLVAVNLTGREKLAVRQLAIALASALNRPVTFVGHEAETAWLWNVDLADAWFGPLTVTVSEMIEATADWVRRGGPTLGKPTHFEVRDGTY